MSGIDGVFRALDVSESALSAQRFRMEVVSKNIAFAEVDSVSGGGAPWRARHVSFETVLDRAAGRSDGAPYRAVRASTRIDRTPGEKVPAPESLRGAPGVDANGYLERSNVDVHGQMIELLQASRSYEANIAAVKAFREMVQRALMIGR
jgi:flagellar basal-body rod protein FlgC